MKNTIDSDIERLVAAAFNCRVPEKTECRMKQVMQEFRNRLHSHPYITFLETCQAAEQRQTGRQESVQSKISQRGFWVWAGIAACVCIIAAASIYISTTYFGSDTSGSGTIIALPAVSNDTVVIDTEVQPETEYIEEEVVSNQFIVFKGTVVEHDSREPLSGVSVVCDGIEEITGADGMFEMELPVTTNYLGQLLVAREAYALVKADIDLEYWEGKSCVIPMYPPASMEGYVRDETGEIVTGIYVSVYKEINVPRGEIAKKQFLSEGPTDKYGFYRIAALAATGRQRYEIEIRAQDKDYMVTSYTTSKLLAQPNATHTNDIVITQLNKINIRVKDADNNSVTSFFEKVSAPKNLSISMNISVKAHEWGKIYPGYFSIDNFMNIIPDPVYPQTLITNYINKINITVSNKEHSNATTNIPIFGSETLYYELKLSPEKSCIAAGKFLDLRGNPIPNITVWDGDNYIYTDTNGQFNMYGYSTPEPVKINYTFTYFCYSTNVPCGDTNIVIRVPQLYNKIIGNVVVGEKGVIPEMFDAYYLSIINQNPATVGRSFYDHSGKFSFATMHNGKNPDWKLNVYIRNSQFAAVILLVPYSDKEIIDVGTIVINNPASKISGRVIDVTGKPAKAAIFLYCDKWCDVSHYQVKGPSEETGNYSFNQLPAGTYKMRVKYNDGKNEKNVDLGELKVGEAKVVPDIIIPRE